MTETFSPHTRRWLQAGGLLLLATGGALFALSQLSSPAWPPSPSRMPDAVLPKPVTPLAPVPLSEQAAAKDRLELMESSTEHLAYSGAVFDGKIPLEIRIGQPGILPKIPLDIAAILAIFGKVQKIASAFDPTSEVSLVNHLKTGTPLAISADLSTLISRARFYWEKSGHRYDPTFFPLKGFWKAREKEQRWPTSEEVAALLPDIGLDKIQLWKVAEKSSTQINLTKTRDNVSLEFGALAKGWALDLCAAELERQGCRHYLINLAGDERFSGTHTEEKPWRVGVMNPLDASRCQIILNTTASGAFGTSGNQFQSSKIGDRFISHIFDPRTGYPVENRILSATVFAPKGLDAQPLGTSLILLGPDEGLRWIAQFPGTEALLLILDDDGKTILERATPGFDRFRTQETTATNLNGKMP